MIDTTDQQIRDFWIQMSKSWITHTWFCDQPDEPRGYSRWNNELYTEFLCSPDTHNPTNGEVSYLCLLIAYAPNFLEDL